MVLLLLALRAVRRFFRDRAIALAVSGTLFSLVLWFIEVISLHQVDHVLYYRIGPIMAVGLLWILACLMTSTGMLISSLEPRPAHGYV
jgi:hypothetical protein